MVVMTSMCWPLTTVTNSTRSIVSVWKFRLLLTTAQFTLWVGRRVSLWHGGYDLSARMFHLTLSEVGLHLDCLQILLLHNLLLDIVVVSGISLQAITIRMVVVVLMMVLIGVHAHPVIMMHVRAVSIVQTFTSLSVVRVVLVHLYCCWTTHWKTFTLLHQIVALSVRVGILLLVGVVWGAWVRALLYQRQLTVGVVRVHLLENGTSTGSHRLSLVVSGTCLLYPAIIVAWLLRVGPLFFYDELLPWICVYLVTQFRLATLPLHLRLSLFVLLQLFLALVGCQFAVRRPFGHICRSAWLCARHLISLACPHTFNLAINWVLVLTWLVCSARAQSHWAWELHAVDHLSGADHVYVWAGRSASRTRIRVGFLPVVGGKLVLMLHEWVRLTAASVMVRPARSIGDIRSDVTNAARRFTRRVNFVNFLVLASLIQMRGAWVFACSKITAMTMSHWICERIFGPQIALHLLIIWLLWLCKHNKEERGFD